MRPLPPEFEPYAWAVPTAEVARIAGIEPAQVLRYDGNTWPAPPPYARTEVLEEALAGINGYPHGGYTGLAPAIAAYARVEPEQVVVGAGADDLILLCARSFAGPGDRVAVLGEPTYPMYRVAAWIAGAEASDRDPVVTFCCRPHNPTGALGEVPAARPLVVDEAYFEFAGESAVGLLDEGVVVLRTFSKAFGLAGARVGYALADRETAAALNERQGPAPLSTLSVALVLAALADPPDVGPMLEERGRLARRLRDDLGLEPLPSHANFLYVPLPGARRVGEELLRQGLVVRAYPDALRITVRNAEDDERLVEALDQALSR